ncbi:hypothetical protein [Sphingosinicella sp. LY1275]|uniref:hypothetical protein n=1 Tax=Sphingosinicella sp. LY1275 TaxID=3095379 RepID=UPI002ADEA8F2|nr:hypothetical protein [Sphingosinicella sp. LY1275]MEA1015336.1 hypothetical protein [Sphingosinicella sp. LY1275]
MPEVAVPYLDLKLQLPTGKGEAEMDLSGFWRRMRDNEQRRGELTIDLAAGDQMDLSIAIIDLEDQQLSALGWTPDQRREVFDALNAHALKQLQPRRGGGQLQRTHPRAAA